MWVVAAEPSHVLLLLIYLCPDGMDPLIYGCLCNTLKHATVLSLCVLFSRYTTCQPHLKTQTVKTAMIKSKSKGHKPHFTEINEMGNGKY
jgi:hypothetical protein